VDQLSSLRLVNWRAFHDITIDFDQTTVIYGDNGSGRTAIVEALTLLSQIGRQRYPALLRNDGADSRLRAGAATAGQPTQVSVVFKSRESAPVATYGFDINPAGYVDTEWVRVTGVVHFFQHLSFPYGHPQAIRAAAHWNRHRCASSPALVVGEIDDLPGDHGPLGTALGHRVRDALRSIHVSTPDSRPRYAVPTWLEDVDEDNAQRALEIMALGLSGDGCVGTPHGLHHLPDGPRGAIVLHNDGAPVPMSRGDWAWLSIASKLLQPAHHTITVIDDVDDHLSEHHLPRLAELIESAPESAQRIVTTRRRDLLDCLTAPVASVRVLQRHGPLVGCHRLDPFHLAAFVDGFGSLGSVMRSGYLGRVLADDDEPQPTLPL